MALRNRIPKLTRGLLRASRYFHKEPHAFGLLTVAEHHSDELLQRGGRRFYSSPSSQEANLDSAFFKPGLVIFDKDGTLVCFHTMWTPWCTSLADRMEKATGMDLSEHVYDVLGYDVEERKVRIGALAENTHPQIKDKIEEMLVSNPLSLSPTTAKQVVEHTWRDTPDNLDIKLTANLPFLFRRLKSEGVKIAICTSDSREGTIEFLNKCNLNAYVDMVVCGDDPEGKPKPNPHNCYWICDKLNVAPSDTIMVGDTPADTLMGQQAQIGLTVGVLTGVGGLHDLTDADVIVHDVHECVDMILPEGSRRKKPIVHQVTTRGISKIVQGSLRRHNEQHSLTSSSFGSSSRRTFSTTTNYCSSSANHSHIIVGAGSAGCVLANRLSEDRHELLQY